VVSPRMKPMRIAVIMQINSHKQLLLDLFKNNWRIQIMQFGILGRRIELFITGMKKPLSKPVIPLLHFHFIRSSRENQLSNMSFMKLILI
jgi:hypothetical protein